MIHGKIERFQTRGKIADDSMFIRQREMHEHLLSVDMRDRGYVPVIDLGPFWSTSLDENGKYDFVLTMHGYFLGKRKACLFLGVDGTGRFYPNVTQNDKSNLS